MIPMAEIVIATRASGLALAQARLVSAALAVHGVSTELREVTTSGDRDTRTSVASLSEVGAFVRAVQAELLEGRADIAVHSCKDLPTEGPGSLVGFYPERESPLDSLVGGTLQSLPDGARIGTGSPRRAAQLLLLRPDLHPSEIRGNVDTRIDKVVCGDYEGAVLALAGLKRLGRQDAVDEVLDVDKMVPAPAQGALCVEARRGSRGEELARLLDHLPTRLAVEAERELLRITGAGCRTALGAFAAVGDESLTMSGFVADERGSRRGTVLADEPLEAAVSLRKELSL